MSNNGSFVPLAVGGGPGGNEPACRPVSKPALGHVVSFPTGSSTAANYGGEASQESRYKWHTVVDGFSKSIKNKLHSSGARLSLKC